MFLNSLLELITVVPCMAIPPPLAKKVISGVLEFEACPI